MVVKEGDEHLPTEGVVDGVAAGRGNDEERRRVEDEGVIVGKRAVNPASRTSKAVAFCGQAGGSRRIACVRSRRTS